MNNPKNMLLIALIFLGFLLYAEWQNDYGPKPLPIDNNSDQSLQENIPTENSDIPQNIVTDDVPEVSNQTPAISKIEENQTIKKSGSIITVTSNVLKLEFDTLGASVVYAELLNYPLSKNSKENVVLINKNNTEPYFAQSGVLSKQQSFVHTDIYQSEKNNYTVSSGEVIVPFTIEKNGVKLTKNYKISADSYLIELTDTIENNGNTVWQGQQYKQLQRTNAWINYEPSFTDTDRMSFKGASYFEPNEGYTQLAFEDFNEDKINVTVQSDAWIAMDQHYFFASFILKDQQSTIKSIYSPTSSTPYYIRATSGFKEAQVNSSIDLSTQLYIGPKIQENLPDIAKGLDLTVDYGMFTAISKPLFWILNHIHNVVGNWGWSIILLTILIKLLFFKLTEKQYNSMARMRKLQPRIKTLKDRHKDNKQKFNEEMMKLYKKEKVNPMGGCLPMLVQIPVFIALYWVLLESVELRQAPFMLWLQDLSSPDPYFILPAINAFAMYMTQKLSPTPGMDPMQAKIMKFMPIGFSVMFAFFQSGLVLYWAVNSSLSLLQQWVITRRIDAQG